MGTHRGSPLAAGVQPSDGARAAKPGGVAIGPEDTFVQCMSKKFAPTELLTPWFSSQILPAHVGWYRTRQTPRKGNAWDRMAYHDGLQWWRYTRLPWCSRMMAREAVKVFQWQGLVQPARDAAAVIRKHLGSTPGVKPRDKLHLLGYAELLELHFTTPAD